MADAALDGNIARVVRPSEFEQGTYSEYQTSDNMSHQYPKVGQGPAKLATAKELARDELGFTHPNLHRRVDPQDPPVAEDERNQEALPRSYRFNIMNVHSYRTTEINTHDEESTYSEIP